MTPEWQRVIELMQAEQYCNPELRKLLRSGGLRGAPVLFFRGPKSRMVGAVVVDSEVLRDRPLVTVRMENGAMRSVELSRLMYIDGLSTRLAPEDSLRVTRLRLKDAMGRRQRAKPGTPAWFRAAEDIKRGDREVARLTGEAARLQEAAYTLPSGERREFLYEDKGAGNG